MGENLKHRYDGRFYDKFIAPNQDEAFRIVRELIPAGSTVPNAGCDLKAHISPATKKHGS